MKYVVLCLRVIMANALHAEEVSCPTTREGKTLIDASFFEWTSASDKRTMARDREALIPDVTRAEGNDWFQSWNVTHAVAGNGLQMVCKYQGLRAGLFLEVSQKVSICTLTKKAGIVEVGCR